MRSSTLRFGVLSLLALAWLANSHSSSGSEDSVLVVSADIIQGDDGTCLASARLGDVTPGDVVSVKLLLRNETDHRIEFDDIATTCSCQDFRPKKGAVGVGKTIAISVDIRTVDLPLHEKGGGRISFTFKGTVGFQLAFDYSFSNYAGFRSKLIVVSAMQQALVDGLEFAIPIVRGSEVGADAIDFSLEGIKGDFSWFEIEKNAQGYAGPKGKIVLKPEVIDSGFARLFGQLTLIRLDSGELAKVPFVIEKADALQVIPAVIRVSASKDKTSSASAYVLNKASPAKEDACVVTAKIGKMLVPCDVTSLAIGKYRLKFRISEELRTRLMKERPEDEHRAKFVMHLDVVCGAHRVTRDVPVTFRGE